MTKCGIILKKNFLLSTVALSNTTYPSSKKYSSAPQLLACILQNRNNTCLSLAAVNACLRPSFLELSLPHLRSSVRVNVVFAAGWPFGALVLPRTRGT